MGQEELAHKYGFNNYKQMLDSSFTVIYDYGVSWIATIIHDGWLTWVDEYPDRPMKTFQTFSEASFYLHKVFEEAEASLKELIEDEVISPEDCTITLN